ncbi:MAG: L-seryl-tRNA(Sec) selenium transferase [Dehalococcoidia bacterium]
MTTDFRSLPSVDRLLSQPEVQALAVLPPALRTQLAREVLAIARASVAGGAPCPPIDELGRQVVAAAESLAAPSLRPLINATGVILHTNLGRAPLSDAARQAMEAVSQGYSNLEYDLESGERGSRYSHLETLLCRISGAEAAMAVNNCAAALLLSLTSLTRGREVVISRSQAVEIGGGFRIPDVMRQSGASLIEVGTTNRTYLRDFESATGEPTAAYLRVHASNFRINGFTAFPSVAELATLAHAKGVLLIDDLGSGCLLAVEQFWLAHEPTVQESVRAGADVIVFSGDKLLGGPQAGIVLCRRELIGQIRAHPLARALRMDKASIAALATTLNHYLHDEALERVPVWQMIAAPLAALERRCSAWIDKIGAAASMGDGRSMIGGGSLPEESLPTKLCAVRTQSATALAHRLRRGSPPVVARTEEGMLLFDPRTVNPQQDPELIQAIRAALDADR